MWKELYSFLSQYQLASHDLKQTGAVKWQQVSWLAGCDGIYILITVIMQNAPIPQIHFEFVHFLSLQGTYGSSKLNILIVLVLGLSN